MNKAKQVMPEIDSGQLIEKLMTAAFDRPRDPRSDAYKLGVKEILKCRVTGVSYRCPYKLGTAEADAFFSGGDEGNRVWRDHLSNVNGGALQ